MTTEVTNDVLAALSRLEEKVDRCLAERSAREGAMEQKLAQAIGLLVEQKTLKEWYSTAEFAEVVRKDEFTVREWCRLGRVNAVKKESGRGEHKAWAISHAELLRYQREGLFPDPRSRPAAA